MLLDPSSASSDAKSQHHNTSGSSRRRRRNSILDPSISQQQNHNNGSQMAPNGDNNNAKTTLISAAPLLGTNSSSSSNNKRDPMAKSHGSNATTSNGTSQQHTHHHQQQQQQQIVHFKDSGRDHSTSSLEVPHPHQRSTLHRQSSSSSSHLQSPASPSHQHHHQQQPSTRSQQQDPQQDRQDYLNRYLVSINRYSFPPKQDQLSKSKSTSSIISKSSYSLFSTRSKSKSKNINVSSTSSSTAPNSTQQQVPNGIVVIGPSNNRGFFSAASLKSSVGSHANRIRTLFRKMRSVSQKAWKFHLAFICFMLSFFLMLLLGIFSICFIYLKGNDGNQSLDVHMNQRSQIYQFAVNELYRRKTGSGASTILSAERSSMSTTTTTSSQYPFDLYRDEWNNLNNQSQGINQFIQLVDSSYSNLFSSITHRDSLDLLTRSLYWNELYAVASELHWFVGEEILSRGSFDGTPTQKQAYKAQQRLYHLLARERGLYTTLGTLSLDLPSPRTLTLTSDGSVTSLNEFYHITAHHAESVSIKETTSQRESHIHVHNQNPLSTSATSISTTLNSIRSFGDALVGVNRVSDPSLSSSPVAGLTASSWNNLLSEYRTFIQERITEVNSRFSSSEGSLNSKLQTPFVACLIAFIVAPLCLFSCSLCMAGFAKFLDWIVARSKYEHVLLALSAASDWDLTHPAVEHLLSLPDKKTGALESISQIIIQQLSDVKPYLPTHIFEDPTTTGIKPRAFSIDSSVSSSTSHTERGLIHGVTDADIPNLSPTARKNSLNDSFISSSGSPSMGHRFSVISSRLGSLSSSKQLMYNLKRRRSTINASYSRNNAGLQEKDASLMLIDVIDFHNWVNRHDLESFNDNYHRFITTVCDMIRQEKGVIHWISGDKIFSSFGCASTVFQSQTRACQSALSLIRITKTKLSKLGISIRVGIASGKVLCGPVGNKSFKTFSCIGSVVNRVYSLCRLNKYYGSEILIDSDTYLATKTHFVSRMVDYLGGGASSQWMSPQGVSGVGAGTVNNTTNSSNSNEANDMKIFELVESKGVSEDEWMYQLSESEEKEKYKSYHAVWDQVLKHDYQRAEFLFDKLISESPQEVASIPQTNIERLNTIIRAGQKKSLHPKWVYNAKITSFGIQTNIPNPADEFKKVESPSIPAMSITDASQIEQKKVASGGRIASDSAAAASGSQISNMESSNLESSPSNNPKKQDPLMAKDDQTKTGGKKSSKFGRTQSKEQSETPEKSAPPSVNTSPESTKVDESTDGKSGLAQQLLSLLSDSPTSEHPEPEQETVDESGEGTPTVAALSPLAVNPEPPIPSIPASPSRKNQRKLASIPNGGSKKKHGEDDSSPTRSGNQRSPLTSPATKKSPIGSSHSPGGSEPHSYSDNLSMGTQEGKSFLGGHSIGLTSLNSRPKLPSLSEKKGKSHRKRKHASSRSHSDLSSQVVDALNDEEKKESGEASQQPEENESHV